MSRTPPSSLMSPPFDQQPSLNMPPLPSSYQSYQSPPQKQPNLSLLQRAMQQSDQQFNTNQTSFQTSNGSGFNSVAPFQPFDLISPTNYTSFPVAPTSNQVPIQYQQQQSPIQPNNIRMNSPQTMSSPSNISHNSSPAHNPTSQQTNSPRVTGGSTLQFVPSQVLRKMPKSNK